MKLNPRIFGAFLIGAGLVSVAYFYTPRLQTPTPKQEPVIAVKQTTPLREKISVEDKNDNQIPDWKDSYTYSYEEPPTHSSTTTYSPPETLTGQTGITLLQQKIESNIAGQSGNSNDEIINSTVDDLLASVQDTPYTVSDVNILPIEQSTEEADRTYFNEVADVLRANDAQTRNELEIMKNALAQNNPDILEELNKNEQTYIDIRDGVLALPVPASHVSLHLEFLNVVQSLISDITAMQKVFDDPLVTLTRLEQYEVDVRGLMGVMQHYYTAIEQSPVLFTETDSAILFLAFKTP